MAQLFAWPGRIADGQVREDLIHGADIPATILDYLGLEVPDEFFGRSYKEVIAGRSSESREEIIGRVTQVRWEGDQSNFITTANTNWRTIADKAPESLQK